MEQQITTAAYSESGIATSDTKHAAILLAFGFRLKKAPFPVAEWAWEFGSKEEYLRWKQGDKSVQIRETATWNLEASLGKPGERAAQITQAYLYSYDGGVKLSEQLRSLELDLAPGVYDQLKALLEDLIVEMCREVLDKREFLVRLLNSRPKEALWIVVRDPNDRRRFSKFGMNASTKVQEDMLNVL
jgi:hypothetical protein